jgi:hypothetical protein
MRLCVLLILLFLPANLYSATAGQGRLQTSAGQDDDTREARALAVEFMRRIQQTRDLASLRDLYVDDFMARISNSNESVPDVGFFVSLSQELMTNLSARDWERYYFAQTNLRYFMVLHLAGSYSPAQISAMEKGEGAGVNLFPPDVLAVLEDTPFLTRDSTSTRYVETLTQFHSLVEVLEKAGTMMRERFRKHPPEQSKSYRANVGDQALAQPKPDLSIDDRERNGFPPGTHFFHVVSKPSLFELTLVKTDLGVKILWARIYPFN